MAIDLFLQTADVVAEAIALPEIAESWREPSVLPQMTVGELVGHLGVAVLTAEHFLDQPRPPADSVPSESAAEFFVNAIASNDYLDGIDSDMQTGIRDGSAALAEQGPEAVVAELVDRIDRLRRRLPTEREPVLAFGGLVMTVDAYLDTRTIEMVVHLDDLDQSIDASVPPVAEAATELAATVLAETSIRRHGALAVALAFARPERASNVATFE